MPLIPLLLPSLPLSDSALQFFNGRNDDWISQLASRLRSVKRLCSYLTHVYMPERPRACMQPCYKVSIHDIDEVRPVCRIMDAPTVAVAPM